MIKPNFHIFLIFFCIINLVQARRLRVVNSEEQEQIDKAQRNAECCAKNMRCCVKLSPPPIEIRAVIARCPNLGTDPHGTLSRTLNQPVVADQELSIKSFQGFDEDEPLIQSRVTACRSKVIMTLQLNHKGTIVCKSQYIVVDHVYDPITDKSARLLNPYVIRLQQEPVSKSYHLKFVDYVNSEAKEEVHNKQEANYTGCYTSKQRSTCGTVKFDGKVIPYSEGFCCSCDSKKNQQRQPEGHQDKNEEIISYSDPAYLLDRVGCPRNYYSNTGSDQLIEGDEIVNITTNSSQSETSGTHNTSKPIMRNVEYVNEGDNEHHKRSEALRKRWKYTTYKSPTTTYRPSYLKRESEEKDPSEYFRKMSTSANKKSDPRGYMDQVKKTHVSIPSYLNPIEDTRQQFTQRLTRKMRQTFPSGVQKRGGQNCADRFTPPGLDPDHYHESAHCLRFSDVWYGIYNLGEPSIEQIVYIKIFEKFESLARSEAWREVTNGTIRLGNRFPHYEDSIPTISMTFTAKILTDPHKYSNWQDKRILIPEGVRACEIHKYPEMRGGPAEYLVVPANRIGIEGEQCDKIGVGFEAFYKQSQRCGVPRGTCLHNQPKHLWRNDKSLEQKKRKGCYFLKYHANITSNPLFVNETTGEKHLFVEYLGAHVTVLDIEIKADNNAVIRDLANAVITEVYVDSTCKKFTKLTIKVINTGLVSSKFMVQLSDFPLELPEYFSKIRSKMLLIPPQSIHIYNLEIRSSMPSDLMYCSVEVVNKKKELVALRRVRIQKFDRCICAWYCLCACVASVTGLKCNPMSLEHYHAAGFEGSLPIVTYMVHFTMLDDLVSVAFYFILFLLGILLLLGIFKALLGLCCVSIGIWGLSVVLDLPKPMKYYYERALRRERVIYDYQGWPLNPYTFQRARNISRATEFCSNVVFFFTYPLACTVIIFRRLFCPYYTKKIAYSDNMPEHKGVTTKSSKKDRPCGNPKCDKKLCSQRHSHGKRKMKKCRSEMEDNGKPCAKQSGRSSSCTSNKSASSHHSTVERQEVVAAFTFEKFKSPLERPSKEKQPQLILPGKVSPAVKRSFKSIKPDPSPTLMPFTKPIKDKPPKEIIWTSRKSSTSSVKASTTSSESETTPIRVPQKSKGLTLKRSPRPKMFLTSQVSDVSLDEDRVVQSSSQESRTGTTIVSSSIVDTESTGTKSPPERQATKGSVDADPGPPGASKSTIRERPRSV